MTNKKKPKFFTYYLDAWNYCRIQKINLKKIKKHSWSLWEVV